MKKIFALVLAMLLLVSNAFAQSLFPPLKTTSTAKELVPSYSVYAGVEPGIVDQVRLDDGKLADSYMYLDVSIEDWSNYVTYVHEENGYEIVSDNFDTYEEDRWVKLTFSKGNVTFYQSFYYPGNILVENYPVEATSGISETRTTDSPKPTPTSAPTHTACSHCYGGWQDCPTCGTFGMCLRCDGMGYTSYGLKDRTCHYCDGTGACSRCGYEGFIKCNYCGGTGVQ